MGDVPGFSPSVNGLRFTNDWPSEPDIEVDVPGFGKVRIGDASNGLCGGMVFTVLDVFIAKLAPLPAARPAPNSALYSYLVRRLFESFDVPNGVLKYFDWMLEPDGDIDLWLTTRRGVSWLTIVGEWPGIQADLDRGRPVPLGLVTVRSWSPGDLGRNHQVLAYGYDLTGRDLVLKVYDPNTDLASADDVRVSLSIAKPSEATTITHNVSIGDPIRGFFQVPYEFSDPSELLA